MRIASAIKRTQDEDESNYIYTMLTFFGHLHSRHCIDYICRQIMTKDSSYLNNHWALLMDWPGLPRRQTRDTQITRGPGDVMGAYAYLYLFKASFRYIILAHCSTFIFSEMPILFWPPPSMTAFERIYITMCIYPWTRCLARNVVYAASVPWHLPTEHHVFMWPLSEPPPVLLRHCYSRCHPTFSCQPHKTAANRMIKSLSYVGECHFKTRQSILRS